MPDERRRPIDGHVYTPLIAMSGDEHFLIAEDEKDEYLSELITRLGPTAATVSPPPDTPEAIPEIEFSLDRNGRTYVFRVERPLVAGIVRELQLASKRRFGRRGIWRRTLSDNVAGLSADAHLLAERHPDQTRFSLGTGPLEP